MSVLGMNAQGVVRTAFEFKDIFDKTGESLTPYHCPFCEVLYIDKCISTKRKRAPHFSLPKGVDHRSGCNGEGPSDDAPAVIEDVDEAKRTVVGDVDFPEALVAARRERARFKLLPPDVVPTPAEVRVRRTKVDSSRLMASRYTSSLLRTFVMAYRTLCELAGKHALTVGALDTKAYRDAFSAVLQSHKLQLYDDSLNYSSAFYSAHLTPSPNARIYRGYGRVERMGDELVICDDDLWQEAFKSKVRLALFVVTKGSIPADAPSLHAETFAKLEHTASTNRKVKWNAYGWVERTENNEFVLRLDTLDHLFLG